ncbi:MAG: Yae1 family protein [Nitrospirae bacterium]|nr:Yae1 family protein [Nitrospirota bacterium]
MPITLDARKTWLFKEGSKDGKRQGLTEGRREGLFEGIELGLELKYGSAGLELMPLVRSITTIDKLEALKSLIKTSGSVDEFFSARGVTYARPRMARPFQII